MFAYIPMAKARGFTLRSVKRIHDAVKDVDFDLEKPLPPDKD